MKFTVSPVFPDKCEDVQQVFNHKGVIEWLGGFTMLEQLKASCKDRHKIGIFGARLESGQCVGAIQVAARPSSFQMKYGQVGVLPEYRRNRISSTLYAAQTMQGILEGRRLFEDSIVSNNPVQFDALPTMGIRLVGTLRHRTGRAHGLALFDFSLLDDEALDIMLSRIPEGAQIELQESFYTKEVFQKNQEIYSKMLPHMDPSIDSIRERIVNLPYVRVVESTDPHPTDARRKAFATRRGFFQDQTKDSK